jgi:hypothetical protein
MTAIKSEKRAEPQESVGDHLARSITANVLEGLGQPAEMHRVVVRRLWADRYRVNVLVGADITSTTIAHSFFLIADGDGTIRETAPIITRQYQSPASQEG